MAGTRLVIQLTFLLEFVLLIVISLYVGLCSRHRNADGGEDDDVLCHPIFAQGGRSSVVLPPEWTTTNTNAQTDEKKESLSSKSLLLKRHYLHVTLVLEESGYATADEWQKWATALDTVLSSSSEEDAAAVSFLHNYHPCLVHDGRPIETEISFQGNFSQLARPVVVVANADKNITEYRISGSTVKQWLADMSRVSSRFDDDSAPVSRLDVLLYVPPPKRKPVVIKLKQEEPATALVYEHQLLTIVTDEEETTTTTAASTTSHMPEQDWYPRLAQCLPPPEAVYETEATSHNNNNDDDDDDDSTTIAVKNALAYVGPFLKQQCGLGSSNSTQWWQRLVTDLHQKAKDNVLVNYHIITTSSLKVPITTEVAQQWRRSMELVDASVQLAESGDYVTAVECLEESLTLSQSLLQNPTLVEPIDLQNDHYMAVFFPLIFPLLVPFVAGAIREAKRYRKLMAVADTKSDS